MYKLTTGDLRLIDESTRPWEMTINPILEKMEELSEETYKEIKGLPVQYREELQEYYLKAMEEDGKRLADPIFSEFDEKWSGEHPEFYDMDRLFEKAGEADRERARDALEAAKKAFER